MKILFIDACTGAPDESRTNRLCCYFLSRLKEEHPEYEISVRKLFETQLGYCTKETLQKREALLAEGKRGDPMFDLANEFAKADKIVIGAPYWDLSFPAVLKCYFENVCVGGIAFKYSDVGSVGLCCAEKLLYITTCGGFLAGSDFGSEYIRGLCGMFGIERFDSVAAESMDVYGCDVEAVLAETEEKLKELAKSW